MNWFCYNCKISWFVNISFNVVLELFETQDAYNILVFPLLSINCSFNTNPFPSFNVIENGSYVNVYVVQTL